MRALVDTCDAAKKSVMARKDSAAPRTSADAPDPRRPSAVALSTRFARPPLRSGPTGDKPTATATYALKASSQGRNGAFRRSRPRASKRVRLGLAETQRSMRRLAEIPYGRIAGVHEWPLFRRPPRLIPRNFETLAPNGGRLGGFSTVQTLRPGTLIDRYGSNFGRFVSPAGTPFSRRGLPPETALERFQTFEVLRPLDVEGSIASPAFGGGLGAALYARHGARGRREQLFEDRLLAEVP